LIQAAFQFVDGLQEGYNGAGAAMRAERSIAGDEARLEGENDDSAA
jgi:hypothetical protein